MRNGTAALLLAAALAAAPLAVQTPLGPLDVADAVAIGNSRQDRERERFHAPYRLLVNRAPVDYIDIVTPFRRIVLAAESRAAIGDRTFGQRQGLELLAEAPEALEIWIELTFHPQNAYVGVPDYTVSVQGLRDASPILARDYERVPRFGPRVAGTPLPLPVPGGPALPGLSEPMLGGTVVARVDLGRLDSAGTYEVIVDEAGREIARARANLASMR